ncbi:MAG: division/cell wall cluster transcriptional repressor MraZ [Oscillospiraceae bacterium]|nr:division/cell wall cluster transcriptional repressor MraZ [Oscillospiraceae bacterium]
MTGQYRQRIDAKGRLLVPAKLREELGETFYVTIGGTDLCLAAYTEAGWQKLTDQLDSMPYSKAKTAIRTIFSNAAKCEPDAQGRILLPQELRTYANLNRDVVVAGASKRAEIWDAEAWDKLNAEAMDPTNLAALMEELGI